MRENRAGEISEEITVKNYLKIMKYVKRHVQEAWRTPSKTNNKQVDSTTGHISPMAENERKRKNLERNQREN